MVITYLGHECFKAQFGDLTLVFNPPSKDSSIKVNKFGADVALESVVHEDMSGGSDYSYGDKAPFVIAGPGEYEIKGVFINGVASMSEYDGDKMINTIYSLGLDGINMVYLGAQSKTEMPSGLADVIDSIDILFVPIGGNGVFDPKEAYKVALNLEPKIIIPMHFNGVNDPNLKAFLKEAGDNVTAIDKLTIKKKDLDGKDGDIVVLAPQS